ncbi:hypothetical protein [Phytoactinopolyspora limicola]|uniref:hypothetical protein n=1 Tax=Phytoactinopolyspora limicola TaxID=2715536 RepID=UPI00140B6609|nr:hypothetical protein [Phytoactinopolyspora limicola]
MYSTDHYHFLHRHEGHERHRHAAQMSAARALKRARTTERAALRRAHWLDRTALLLARVAGWSGGLANHLHDRAISRRARAYSP